MSDETTVRFVRLPHGRDLPSPGRSTAGSAGLDLRAAVDAVVEIGPCERLLVPTGLQLAIPLGFEGQIRPRSGLARRHGVTVANSPGTIDSDYRGEVGVLLVNLGSEPYRVRRGDRIAQLVIAPVVAVELHEADTLEGTERGEGGFGSTGVD